MVRSLLLHPIRREGKGTESGSVVRHGDMCAFEGCPEHARDDRFTKGGYIVGYCRRHRLQAELAFDGSLTQSAPQAA